MSSKDQENVISQKISSFLEGAFESVALTRKEYFDKNPSKIPSRSEVESIITSYSNQNAVASGASGLIPGPAGALAVVPELTFVLRNQIQMIYDIGAAHGKTASLDASLLMAIFSTAAGSGAIGLMTVHGSKLLVRRASLRVMQRIVILLGGKITQQALKSLVAKWVPVVGAAGMAYWSRHTTKQIGDKAAELFKKDIEIIDGTDLEEEISTVSTASDVKEEKTTSAKRWGLSLGNN